MTQLVRHHIKYKEIHGEDEVVLMTRSKHRLLHNRLRKEGICNVSPVLLSSISQKARRRSGVDKEYQKQYRKVLYHFIFTDTLLPYIQLLERISYNYNTGNISVLSKFNIYKRECCHFTEKYITHQS